MVPGKPSIRVGGTLVSRYFAADVVKLVRQRVTVAGSPPLAVGSVNVDHLHHFRAGEVELGNELDWLWLADGAPVAWRGSRLSGGPWPRVTGADLLGPLLDVCAEHQAQVGFFGGMPQTHERLAAVLAQRHPSAPPPLFWSPAREEIESSRASTELAAQIRACGVHVLVVGLGKPRQELWMERYGAATGAAVLLAFGAAADFLAGEVNRAPVAYQKYGLEWLYRLRQEPRRLARRYLLQGPPAVLRLRHAVLDTPTSEGLTPTSPARPGWRTCG
ncbi:WecB/TagA/CpsF family glycosyltransferase [Mycolicibacterium peregrinum]|nr:WecB/TagA/CpsF family glycosyltransferase [Mycolicibacterium peregrinum]